MPELPEVETIVRGLRTVLPGRTIVSVRLGKTDFIEDPLALAEQLPGRRIEKVERMGKFISLELSAGPEAKNPERQFDLVIHLGMTGWLGVRRPADPVAPHTHAFFELENGQELRYTDIRRFGQILPRSRRRKRRFQRTARERAAGDFRRGVQQAAGGPPGPNQSPVARSAHLPRHRQYIRRRKFVAGAHSSRAARCALESSRTRPPSDSDSARPPACYPGPRLLDFEFRGRGRPARRIPATTPRLRPRRQTLFSLRNEDQTRGHRGTKQLFLSALPKTASVHIRSNAPAPSLLRLPMAVSRLFSESGGIP